MDNEFYFEHEEKRIHSWEKIINAWMFSDDLMHKDFRLNYSD